MAVHDLKAVGLGDLLGSLLSAVVEGQHAATASSLSFVRDYCMDQDGEDADRFRTVRIQYTKLDENQEPADFVLDVPLLAMVHIPTLTVKQAKIAFKYDVLTTTQTTEGGETAPSATASALPRLVPISPVTLVGYVRSTTRSSSSHTRETTGVDVEVTVESEPLPLGLERILDLTELAVSRQVTPEEDDT